MKTTMAVLALCSLALGGVALAEEPAKADTPAVTAPTTQAVTAPTTQTAPAPVTQAATTAVQAPTTTPPAAPPITEVKGAEPTAATPPPAGKKHWFELETFIKNHPKYAANFKKAFDALQKAREALKKPEADLKAQKDKAERAKLTVLVNEARKAVWRADIAWHQIHINWKNHQKNTHEAEMKALIRKVEHFQKSFPKFMKQDYLPSMHRWKEQIKRLEQLIKKTK